MRKPVFSSLIYSPKGELRLSGNHTMTVYKISGKPYSQKSGLKNHTNEQIFQVNEQYFCSPYSNITTYNADLNLSCWFKTVMLVLNSYIYII